MKIDSEKRKILTLMVFLDFVYLFLIFYSYNQLVLNLSINLYFVNNIKWVSNFLKGIWHLSIIQQN